MLRRKLLKLALNVKKSDIDRIFQIFHDNNPSPTTELEYTNNYTLLVAVVISAQTTDKAVNKATKDLFKVADTPRRMLELGEEKLKGYIKTIGLYNNKAKNVIALSEKLITEFGNVVPDNAEDLQKLPGVGRKSANVVLSCVFDKVTMPVDTHVFRLARRIGLSDGKNVNQVENDLMRVIPKKWLKNAHHWLVLHGRYVCKSIKPMCSVCPISKYCEFFKSNISS